MNTEIILIYCVCDDYLKCINYYESSSRVMNDAEVLTHTIVSAMFFYGNHETARTFLKEHHYVPNMLSKSQLNRRIHHFSDGFWQGLLNMLFIVFEKFNQTNEYVVDSFPVSVCDTARISRCKIYQGKEYHGYSPTKQRYFYGIKVHAITTIHGFPKEIIFTPGSEHDTKAFRRFNFDIPENSIIYADRGYKDYSFEDLLKEHAQIYLIAERAKNSKRPLRGALRYIQSIMRKRIETAFSQITSMFPRSIKAVTSSGFEIKIFNFIIAFACKLIFKNSAALT